MRKLVRYDVYRAFHQASTYVLLAITLVLTVFTVGDVTFFSEEPSSDLVFTYGSALASGKNILLMLAGCLCGMLIGEDFSVGSYSLAVSSGYSRWKIVGGRTISCFIVISIMLAEFMLVSLAASMVYVKTFTAGAVLRIIALSILHTLYFCMMNMICIFMGFVLKKKVNATAVCLFIVVLLSSLIGTLCTKVEKLTPLYLKTVPVITYTMFGATEKALTVAGSTLVFLLITAAIFYATGKVFEKEELA